MKLLFSKLTLTNVCLVFFIVFITAACSSTDESDDDPDLNDPAANLAGRWDVIQVQNGNCPSTTYPHTETDTASIAHTEQSNNFTVYFESYSKSFSGIISDTSVSWKGSLTHSGQTDTIDFSGTVSNAGTTVTGTAKWTWTNGSSSCSGTSDVTATKQKEPADVNGIVFGKWQSTEGQGNGSFWAIIDQETYNYSDTYLNGYIRIAGKETNGDSLYGSVNENSLSFNDFDEAMVFSGDISNDSILAGSYTYNFEATTDSGTWNAFKAETSSFSQGLEIDFLSPAGLKSLTFDGSHFWYIDSWDNRIYRLDTNGAIDASFDAPGPNPTGLTWGNSFLWIADADNKAVYKTTPTGLVDASFDTPGSQPVGLAFASNQLWSTDTVENKIYRLDTSGDILSSFSFTMPEDYYGGLTFDGTHLWLLDNYPIVPPGRMIYKIDQSGDSVTVFGVPCDEPAGLATQENDIWLACNNMGGKLIRLMENMAGLP